MSEGVLRQCRVRGVHWQKQFPLMACHQPGLPPMALHQPSPPQQRPRASRKFSSVMFLWVVMLLVVYCPSPRASRKFRLFML
eukprot:2883949-Amphidinium_carterae.1